MLCLWLQRVLRIELAGLLILGLLAACTTSATSATPSLPGKTNPTVGESSDIELVIFYSPVCTSCREAIRVVGELEQDYQSRILFTWVNVLDSENQTLMEYYGFSSPPEIYLMDRQGMVIDFWDEAPTPDELRQSLDSALSQ